MNKLKVGIVGAGIQGISNALFLQKKGFDVTIFDREEPGSPVASYGNAGHFSPYASLSLNRTDVEDGLETKSKRIQIILKLLERPKKLLATILVANNFINIGIVILFAYLSGDLFMGITSEILRFVVEVVIVTFLILLFGEILPKIYASRNNLKFAIFMAYPLRVLDVLLSPVSLPMRSVTLAIHNKLGRQKSNLSINQLSQALELTSDEDTTKEALLQLSKFPLTRYTNVVYSSNWHKGVIGIVASRIIDYFYKPTIVFSGDGDLITGSARSVKEFDIYNILNQLKHYFTRFGGHKYAAGLTIERRNLADFSRDFEKLVADNLSEEVRQKKISVDVDITLEKLFQNLNKNGVPKLMRIIKQMEPFGPSNPRPVFCFKKLYFKAPPRIVGRKHIKFLFTDFQQAKHIGGIWFNSAEKLQKINQLNKADVVGSVVENYYNNQMSLQLNIKDVKPS